MRGLTCTNLCGRALLLHDRHEVRVVVPPLHEALNWLGSASVKEGAVVWGIMARVGLSLLVLVIVTVVTLVVMMWAWPCIGLLIALSVVGAAAVVWRRRAFYERS